MNTSTWARGKSTPATGWTLYHDRQAVDDDAFGQRLIANGRDRRAVFRIVLEILGQIAGLVLKKYVLSMRG
jgi:hypothetical protein